MRWIMVAVACVVLLAFASPADAQLFRRFSSGGACAGGQCAPQAFAAPMAAQMGYGSCASGQCGAQAIEAYTQPQYIQVAAPQYYAAPRYVAAPTYAVVPRQVVVTRPSWTVYHAQRPARWGW